MQQSLFGPVETKREAIQRAKRIRELRSAIRDAPNAIACCHSDVQLFDYFIERSRQISLDANDLDGLQRFIGEPEELLTERDCRAMRKNLSIWRDFPEGWPGARAGDKYPAALHPKEIAYLRRLQKERAADVDVIRSARKRVKAELAALESLGPLPDDVAAKYHVKVREAA